MSKETKSTVKVAKNQGKSTVRFHMCGDRLLLDLLPMKLKSGNIILPSGYNESLVKSRVVAIGPEVKTVHVGDIVVHVSDLGTEIKDHKSKKSYINLPENAMIAIDTEFDEEAELSKNV